MKRLTARVPGWLLVLALLALTALPAPAAPPADTMYQVSTLQALLIGVYDGQVTFAQLAGHGDLGLGTVQGLDGEMVALEGRFYQVRADGKVVEIPVRQTTPFANLVAFRPDQRLELKGPLTLAQLKAKIDAALGSPNQLCALRVKGRFSLVKARSVPGQQKPYPPLVEVVKKQSVWQFKEIDGSLVGFFLPAYLKGINASGYHLHFLDKTRQKGGHVLDAVVTEAVVELDRLYALEMVLPRQGDFYKAGLAADMSQAVHKVEK